MVSLLKLAEITEQGVQFESPHDGSLMLLTPEHSMSLQNSIGADIMMQLDDVVSSLTTGPRVEEAMWRSIRWYGLFSWTESLSIAIVKHYSTITLANRLTTIHLTIGWTDVSRHTRSQRLKTCLLLSKVDWIQLCERNVLRKWFDVIPLDTPSEDSQEARRRTSSGGLFPCARI